MKNIKTLIATFATALVVMGAAQAQSALVATTGPAAPNSPTTVGGSIAKYITFTKTDTSINLGDMGGPTFGLASPVTAQNGGAYIRYFESAAPTADAGKGQKSTNTSANTTANRVKGTGNSVDSAEITWDANTHVKLAIVYGKQMSVPSSGPQDPGGQVLRTWFRTQVKGRDVRMDGDLVAASPVGGAPAYVDMDLTPAPAVTEAPPLPDYTYDFSHGPSNGIKLDVQVQRLGVRDHWGTYQTGVTTLTWTDLN